jgi:PAS domain S-box-containing protein
MTSAPLRVLILEDVAEDAELTVAYLTAEGFTPAATVVQTESEFRAALTSVFDLIICDYSLPAFDGLSAIRMVRAAPGPQPPVIVVTGTATEDEAVECMREGAADYLLKDRPARFGQAVRQALASSRLASRSEEIERGMLSSEAQLKMAQRIAHMGSWEYRYEDDALSVSEVFREVFDLAAGPAAIDLSEVLQRVHPDDRARVSAAIKLGAERRVEPVLEYRIVRADGAERAILAHSELAGGPATADVLRGTVQDVTERKEAEQRLYRSQQLFEQGFETAPIGMGLIDPAIRAFGRVNDAMCAIAGQTREELQTADWLVRAIHPDDLAADTATFAQLLDGTLRSHTQQKRLVRPDGTITWISLTLSALRDPGGVVGLFGQVIDISDQKAREQRLTERVEEVSWIGRIRDALDEDRFILHAQPIIDLATGDTVQHELLIRMIDRDGRLVSPGEFLPTAERFGLITEIDRWVIEQGARLAADGGPVAINLSGASIGNPEILAAIERAIAASGAPPGNLVFEITETALMENLDRGELFAEQLIRLGCHLALDDFGTGFCSFTYLKRIHAHHLKIDIEFVRDLAHSERDQHVVTAIVALATGFGQLTTAEGVEDQETMTLLRELGVSHAQGYHVGSPLPVAELLPAAAVV